MSDPTLQDEAALSWNFLEDEHDPCIVVSERMDLVYINGAAQRLVPQEWFGKRCFEVFPVVDESCAFHYPKIDAVSESPETSPKVVYCEEALYTGTLDRVVLGGRTGPAGRGTRRPCAGGLRPENQGRIRGCRRIRVEPTAGCRARTTAYAVEPAGEVSDDARSPRTPNLRSTSIRIQARP